MVHEQTIEGKWTELGGRIKEQWGNVTDDDLAAAEGKVEILTGIIQQRTGESLERVEAQLERMINALDSHNENFRRKVAEGAERSSEKVFDYADRASQAAFKQYEQFHGQYDELAAEAQRRLEEGRRIVRRHPAQSLGVAFGVGLFAGLALGFCCRRSGD